MAMYMPPVLSWTWKPSSEKLDLNVPEATVTLPSTVTYVPGIRFFAFSINIFYLSWAKVESVVVKTKMTMVRTERTARSLQQKNIRDRFIRSSKYSF